MPKENSTKIFSCTFQGLDCQIIEVQADIAQGIPQFNIVGLGDTSVQESKERIRASIKNSGFQFPQTRKTINLAPAEIRKHGSLFDLPIALSILIASKQIPIDKFNNSVVIGELSLNGEIKKINGVLPITQLAKEKGFEKIFLPKENASEASFIDGMEIYGIETLNQLTEFALGKEQIIPFPSNRVHQSIHKKPLAFLNIFGMEKAKRALVISAAGGHNILLSGSPGCGKTIICRSFRELQSPMGKEEIMETTKIYSVSGLLDENQPIITERPFRELHHTASLASVIGGGKNPRPGEISLAHNGTIFFDEIAEFPKQILEALRQPMEDKYININRINGSLRFPSNFQILATMNPCPCGYYEDKKIPCTCSENQIRNYQKKLSGPLLDRFDLFIRVHRSKMRIFFETEMTSQVDYLKQIERARNRQEIRFLKSKISRNSEMSASQIRQLCGISKEAEKILNLAINQFQFSNRAYLKILKVARTIADLDDQENINEIHLSEALQYRGLQ